MNKEEQMLEIKKVEKAIEYFFEVRIDNVYAKISKRKESLARSFIFYILHVDMGLSVGFISKMYGRTSNAVFKSLSKIKYRVDKMHAYKEMYLGIYNIKDSL